MSATPWSRVFRQARWRGSARRIDAANESWSERKARLGKQGRDLLKEQRIRRRSKPSDAVQDD
jgi:hypothetical protein